VCLFQFLQILLPLRNIFLRDSLGHLLGLVVQDYQIPIHKIEPIELVAGLFGVNHIIIDHECGPLGRGGGASTNLTYGAKLREEVKERRRIDVVGEIFDEENSVGKRG
jgi:hypothetical protein